MQKILAELTLVCATLGDEKKITNLLESILCGTNIPKRIILVTFNEIEIDGLIDKFNDKQVMVEIIKSSRPAQVYQRNIGINAVDTEYIIQCDDDIRVLLNSIEKLYEFTYGIKDTLCSPRVLSDDGNSIYKKNQFIELLNKFIYFIFNFKWPINALLMSVSGRNYAPVNLEDDADNQWLPSCLMYKKELFNLSTFHEDVAGKGYFEDIIFTHSLYRMGIKLKIVNDAIFIHPKIGIQKLSLIKPVFHKQLVVCKIFKLNIFAAYIDIILYYLFLSIRSFKK